MRKPFATSVLSLGLLGAFLSPALLRANDLEVCKQADYNTILPVQGTFSFTVFDYSNNSIIATLTAPVGGCSNIIETGAGTFQVTETAQPSTVVTAITAVIMMNGGGTANGLVSSDLSLRTAKVTVGGPETTVVTFTNAVKPQAEQGCTPGFFKQIQHFGFWTGYYPTEPITSVFTNVTASLQNETLIDALQGGGGPDLAGAETILLRAAVAALLNASSANVAYPLTAAQVIAEVDAALATSNRDTILNLATVLDNLNNGPGGCPLSNIRTSPHDR